MLESILASQADSPIHLDTALISFAVAILCGLALSIVYMQTNKRSYTQSFVLSLVFLPAIVSVIILLVGNNIARAFSIAGAFTLIRFRSTPGDSKDILYVFITMGIGLAAGLGYITYSLMITSIVSLIMVLMSLIKFGNRREARKTLKITIPENMNYSGVFDEVFDTFTTFRKLDKIKTSNLGTLFELTYSVSLKQGADEKDFIDQLRCRNGNLNISLLLSDQSANMLL
ncbi:MAG: DUF4956 domain-containing protein [Eubacteriales bacterium]